MNTAKSYNQAREVLFVRLLILATMGLFLVALLNLLSKNYIELYVSLSFLSVFIVAWFSFKRVSKKLAYHLLIIGFVLIICYPIFILGKSYYAIIIYPAAGLTYNFVFFEKRKVLWIYFVVFVVLEFFLLASTMKIDFGNIPTQFYAEYINALAYMICLFFFGQFFITNLRKQKKELSAARLDIEEKKDELNVKNETLDKYIESNIQLESFAHLAAHELKAPLRSISGFAGLLRRKIQAKLSPEEDEMFDIISTSNRQMHDMISALNQLGSVSKMELNPSEFEINKLITEISFDRKEAISESKAVVKIDIGTPLVIGDRTLLKQLLSNLIGNALKFVEKDEIPIVSISIKKTEKSYVFKIDDNGIGIRTEDRKKIFTLFERLNNSKSYCGSGIGLAISKKIVDLHGGEIWVDPVSPKGSSFVFTIPFV